MPGRGFAGYALLINVWGTGCKSLLPVVALLALGAAGEKVTAPILTAGVGSGVGFVALAVVGTSLLASQRWALVTGRGLDRIAGWASRLVGRPHEPLVGSALVMVRRDCRRLVAAGWLRMSAGITGYAALQCLLLAVCLHLARAGTRTRRCWPGSRPNGCSPSFDHPGWHRGR